MRSKEVEEDMKKLEKINLYIGIKPSTIKCLQCCNEGFGEIQAEIVINPYLPKAIETVLNYIEKLEKLPNKIRDKIEILEKLQNEFKENEELRIKIIAYKELLEEEK